MSKISLIIKREYFRRVRKKSFLLITFLTPFGLMALVLLPLWLAGIRTDQAKEIAIIDTTGKYAPLFENTDAFHFSTSNQTLQEYRENTENDIFAVLNITDDLLENPQAGILYSDKQIPGELSYLVSRVLRQQIETDKLSGYNIPHLKEILEDSKVNFSIQTIKWGADGKENVSSSTLPLFIGIGATLLISMFIMIYAGMVMQGVMEEKTNRIIELIISSVRPFDLMMGKITGILLVGLTQVLLWVVILFGFFTFISVFLTGNLSPEMMEQTAHMNSQMGIEITENIPGIFGAVNLGEIMILFILFFIGGYFLYASLFAAIGSAMDSQEDTQQFMLPINMLVLFAIYAGIYSGNNPDGPLAFWCSFVPLTSPIVMMVRIPFDVPVWQIILSLVILYSSAIGIIWLSAKIYKVGILMYGKKPSLKELAKWLQYK